VKPVRSHKKKVALAIAVISALVAWYAARDMGETPPGIPPIQQETHERQKPVAPISADVAGSSGVARFDFYLLALSLHAAFCADGHGRMPECSGGGSPRILVIHGLWPERLKPGTYPHDCAAPRLQLEPGLEAELVEFMPGMRSDLHVHEWRKHGGCTALDDDDYYRRTLALTRELDSALSARLTTLAGGETNAAALRAYADEFRPGLGATLVFQCRTLRDAPAAQRGRPFLVEVRQCIDDDGPAGAPETLLDCATVQRRDQGCGNSFLIAGTRLWK
jgi:ribonuclease I